MSRFTTTTLRLLAFGLGLGLLSVATVAQAQDNADPLRTSDDSTVGGPSDIINSPFDLFHEAVLSGGVDQNAYREGSRNQINEAAAEFRQENGYGQQPLRFEYEAAPVETVEPEEN